MGSGVVVVHIPDGPEGGMAIAYVQNRWVAAETLCYGVGGGNYEIVAAEPEAAHEPGHEGQVVAVGFCDEGYEL